MREIKGLGARCLGHSDLAEEPASFIPKHLIPLLLLLVSTSVAHATLKPEHVVVVVNESSVASRTVAKAYVRARGIPPENTISLNDVPAGLKVSLEDFQAKILMPVLKEIESKGLASRTRVIAYSAGFPTSVNVSKHHQRLDDDQLKKYQKPTASITGLTYLYQFLLADSANYLGFGSNLYARGSFERHFVSPFMRGPEKDAFDAAMSSLNDGDDQQAAESFEELLRQHPRMSPIAVRAAECRSRLGETAAAERLVRQAILSGWSSARYLRESDSLESISRSDRLKSLVDRLDDYPTSMQGPIEFSSRFGWANNGHPHARSDRGVRYMMSCMLAVVHERGSNIEEAIDVLDRSSKSDESNPKGKFWFAVTKDIRTKTRFPAVGNAIEWLRHLQHDADLVHAVMPSQESDCVGLMLGTPSMPLGSRSWTFVPGAISENLTSLSAAFGTKSQSKITELLHAGAALSGGAVAEPYSIPNKFPSPMLYGYYATGLSGIEAFYLSITSPYQYLIVGDPLVRPFSKR
ncbi:MAG: hypothetical protein AAGG48_10195 [Planctomycetota bacterium]